MRLISCMSAIDPAEAYCPTEETMRDWIKHSLLRLTRRQFVAGGTAATAALAAGCSGGTDGGALPDGSDAPPPDAPLLDGGPDAPPIDVPPDTAPDGPTPECLETDVDQLGPYYRADAPFRTDLNITHAAGVPLVIRGQVFGPDCVTPIARALLDPWQADDDGIYDNATAAFEFRGRLYADDAGRYEFRTVLPGYYVPRPRHVHLKVDAPGYVSLTTQIYFTDDPQSAGVPRTLRIPLTMDIATGGLVGVFNVVLVAV